MPNRFNLNFPFLLATLLRIQNRNFRLNRSYSNLIWIFFLGLVILSILCYTIYSGYHFWQYKRLNQQTRAEDVQWTIISLSDEEFIPFARYRFQVKGKNYQGQTLWKEIYLNEWPVREAITRFSSQPILVWFDQSNPEVSSLQKKFPLKESLYTLLLGLLGLYFWGLRYYVKQRYLI